MLRAAFRMSGLRLMAGTAAMGRGEAGSVMAARQLCTKPEKGGTPFKVPGHRPSDFDKKILLWSGRFKKQSDIPEFVSPEMLMAAKSKLRVKFAYIMILLTIVGCIAMVISGKRAAGRQETVTRMNLERKARLRAEKEQ